MGCILVKIFDPAPPDSSIRAFWHVDGLIIDSIDPLVVREKSKNTSSEGLDVSRPVNASTPLIKASSESHISSFAKIGAVQRRPAGVLYVYNGRLVYLSRRCSLLNRQKSHHLQIDIREIDNVNTYNSFTSHKAAIKDCKSYSGQVVDIIINSPSTPQAFHIGFFTRDAEEVSSQLSETCVKHRQKPKIFQFNSVDIEGVEIELP